MSDAAPERIWIQDLYSAPWPGAYRTFHATDLLHAHCPEYLRLDLHTAALAERDARIAALEAGLRECAQFTGACGAVARALLDGGKP